MGTEARRRYIGHQILSLFLQGSRLWARWEIANPFSVRETSPRNLLMMAGSSPQFIPQQLNLRGGGREQPSPGPLQKGCNCSPGSPRTTGCSLTKFFPDLLSIFSAAKLQASEGVLKGRTFLTFLLVSEAPLPTVPESPLAQDEREPLVGSLGKWPCPK